MKPHAAQIRQAQRRARLQETLSKTNVDATMYAQYQQRMGKRTSHVITQAEWEELVEKHEDSGKGFRYFFFALVVALCLLILYGKYDSEYMLEVPQIENGRGFAGDASPKATKATLSEQELNKYFETLGVQSRFSPVAEDAEGDEAKRIRLENFRVKNQVKEAYEKHLEGQRQLVSCGRSCLQKQNAVQEAYHQLVAQVDRELFSVLLDTPDTKSGRSVSPKELKKRYEEKKARIEETEKDPEVRRMELEELRDAYDILQDGNARLYYLLKGEKPPDSMRYVSARHGGWGQEMALGTFKYKLIIVWLDFLHKYLGLWGETIVLLLIVGGVLAKLPAALKQSRDVLDDLNLLDDDEESDKNK